MSGSFEVYDNIAKLKSVDFKVREEAYLRLKTYEAMEIIDFNTLIKIQSETNDISVLNYVIEALGRRKEERCFVILDTIFKQQKNILLLQTLLYAFIQSESDYFIDSVLEKLQYKKSLLKKNNKNDFMKIYNKIIHLAIKYFQVVGNKKVIKFLLPLLQSQNQIVSLNSLLVFDTCDLPLDQNILKDLMLHKNDQLSLKAKFMLQKRQQDINS